MNNENYSEKKTEPTNFQDNALNNTGNMGRLVKGDSKYKPKTTEERSCVLTI